MRRLRLRRALGVIGLLAVAALGLTACNPIPGSGPVEVGLPDFSQTEQTGEFNPTGPVEGATQEDIVRGFILAASSSSEDYSVAREFLTTDYATQWDPYFGVLIDDGTRPFRSDGPEAGVLSLSAVAKVDARGLLLPAKPGPSTDMRFEFEQVGGEWRISSAPAGVILDRITFNTVWSQYQLYFIGAGGYLVPETRWFLKRAALPTEVVGELIAGPSESMQDVLRSGFPAGVTLLGGSVTVSDGKARIDLSGEILEAGRETLDEIARQLRASLQALPGVSGFDLYAEGTAMRDLPSERESGLGPVSENYNPAVMRGEEFGSFVAGEFVPDSGLGDRIAELDPEAVALSPDEATAVVLGDDGVSRVDRDGAALVDARPGQLDPSIDLFGYVWTSQRSEPEELNVTTPDGSATAVAASWLAGRNPVAVRISPDGSRIAALVADGDGSALLVAGVVRDESGAPVSTTEAVETQMWMTGEPVDFDWVDRLRYAALTRLGNAGKVTLGGPGLFSSEQGSVQGGVTVSGGGSRTQVRVLNDDGELFSPQGSGWQRIAADIDLLAKHG